MSPTAFASFTAPQFEAALTMLRGCVRSCPPDAWRTPIANYPFWQVVYHTLCFTDLYLSPSLRAWRPDKGTRDRPGLHPRGTRELWLESPSREYTPDELDAYAVLCREKLIAQLKSETTASLKGPSGFRWIPGRRPETYLYNLRHLSHHVGQLSAALRRMNVSTPWRASGWTEPGRGRRVKPRGGA